MTVNERTQLINVLTGLWLSLVEKCATAEADQVLATIMVHVSATR